MDNNFRWNYVPKCPHCDKRLNDWFIGNFKGRYFNQITKRLRVQYYCNEEHYTAYKEHFVVEVYNGKPIYCITVDGEHRYMPYFEADYYFTNIEDCKKRMDMKHASIIPQWINI